MNGVRSARPTRTSRGDAGSTLTELMMAIAIFGVLMALVAVGLLTLIRSMSGMTNTADKQGDAQVAAEWISRELRYMDVPENEIGAVVQAGTKSITFYTYSGTGSKHDVPYKVTVYVNSSAANAAQPCSVLSSTGAVRHLCTEVVTPARISGAWNWPTNLASPASYAYRELLSTPATSGDPMSFTIYALNPTLNPAPSPSAVTLPSTPAALNLSTGQIPGIVVVKVGDPTNPRNMVTQQVKLVNCDEAKSC